MHPGAHLPIQALQGTRSLPLAGDLRVFFKPSHGPRRWADASARPFRAHNSGTPGWWRPHALLASLPAELVRFRRICQAVSKPPAAEGTLTLSWPQAPSPPRFMQGLPSPSSLTAHIKWQLPKLGAVRRRSRRQLGMGVRRRPGRPWKWPTAPKKAKNGRELIAHCYHLSCKQPSLQPWAWLRSLSSRPAHRPGCEHGFPDSCMASRFIRHHS